MRAPPGHVGKGQGLATVAATGAAGGGLTRTRDNEESAMASVGVQMMMVREKVAADGMVQAAVS